MPKFSKKSLERLGTCHPDLELLFEHVIKHYDCSVICGLRSKEEQNTAYEEGTSKVKYPNSKHNASRSYGFSCAVDVAPYPIDWLALRRFYHFGGFVQGMAADLYDAGLLNHKIRWGGDWDRDRDFSDQRFNDLVHFELGEQR